MNQPVAQPEPEPDFLHEAQLRDLLDQTPAEEPNYVIIQDEKPKRKGKPKPRLQLAPWLQISLVSGVIGFVVAAGLIVLFVTPVSSPQGATAPNINPVFPAPVQPALPISSDPLVDQWMRLGTDTATMTVGTDVRVLSADATEDWYNVADMQGNLSMVNSESLLPGSAEMTADMHPPLGPFAAALGQNQRLLVTTEWNGDLPPGTPVYAMGWRAEDGTWIYEVSPDRVRTYFLPWIHLAPLEQAS
jgi:hypothetical protein